MTEEQKEVYTDDRDMAIMTHYDRVRAAKLKYIRAVLKGVEMGDDWFNDKLAHCKEQWPDMVNDEVIRRGL